MNSKKINGAIIVNKQYGSAQNKIDHKVARLVDEFILLNVDVDVIKNNGDLICIENNEVKSLIKDYAFIIYLDKDKYTLELLEKANYKVFNNAKFIELCDDKILTHIATSSLGINMPSIISVPLNFVTKEEKEDEIFVNNAIKTLSLPIVLKTAFGSLGEGVNLFHTYEEALFGYRKYKTLPCFFQQYIEANNSSIRVLIIDKEIVVAIERINETDFRSNTLASTNFSKPYKVSKKLEDIVNKLINHFNIEYAGIDFIKDENGEYYLLEMNSNAFFSEAEKVSGINIAKKYCQYILKSII